MSRSKQTDLNPIASKTFEWSSETGSFKWYDKSEEKNFEQALPFKFLVLDKLSAIGGWSDEDKSGIWSNEVKNTKTQELTARTKKGQIAKGLYASIKADLALAGGKYAQILYVAYYEGKSLSIGKIKLIGSSLSSFIDFSKDNNIMFGAIEVDSFTDAKKGITKYKIPNFKKIEISDETEKSAVELDRQVQEYLTAYFDRGEVEQTTEKMPPNPAAEKPKSYKQDVKMNDSGVPTTNDPTDDLPF